MHDPRPVIAYHLILTCYGFWLPNDPRGSGSNAIWAEALRPFGPATKVRSQRSVAGRAHDVRLRRAAKRSLARKPVRFTGRQAHAVAQGFAQLIRSECLTCYACSVMPDHAHLVLSRGAKCIEDLAIDFKAASVHTLLLAKLHPYQQIEINRPKIWARGARHPFLFDDRDINRAVRYVEDNPLGYDLPRQHWSFVTPLSRERSKRFS